MKQITLAALTLLIVSQSFAWSGPDIRLALQETFHKNFPNAGNVHWEEDQSGYTVSFVFQSIYTRITYDRKGRFTGSLRNYSEQFLPFSVTNEIKREYPSQDIFGVTEVSSPSGLTYFVKLESPKTWTTICMQNDGTFSVVEKYDRVN
jgi:hypothetical protein